MSVAKGSPTDTPNKTWIECHYCAGTGQGDPNDAAPGEHTPPCWDCDGAGGWWGDALPKETP